MQLISGTLRGRVEKSGEQTNVLEVAFGVLAAMLLREVDLLPYMYEYMPRLFALL
jgi:hypothetical protein